MHNLYKKTISVISEDKLLSNKDISKAQAIINQCDPVLLSQGLTKISVLVETEADSYRVDIIFDIDNDSHPYLKVKVDGSESDWSPITYAALLFVENNTNFDDLEKDIKYTELGMRYRVYAERQQKADNAEYKVKLADNVYGEHLLTNEKGHTFKVTLRNFTTKTGYIDNIDLKTNKLGTTKHILFLYNYFEEKPSRYKRLKKSYPFIEIYADPLNDYKISWFYSDELTDDESSLLQEYFGKQNFINEDKTPQFFGFIQKAFDYKRIKIRTEVIEKIEKYYNQIELAQIQANTTIDYSTINATLYPYQKQGITFSVFKKGVIIADEMGLGKTLQAIGTAIIKKNVFGFSKTLVITPASVKQQWLNEIKKFCSEKAIIIEGFPEIRNELYRNDDSFFHIINYETVMRDLNEINKVKYDFVILDEAQKIKNYETKTANAVKAIDKSHALVITGTPIENKLLDLYSIVQFIDPYFLAPQWEFSYQHCLFDSSYKNKINGYYNLVHLKQRLNQILIRREKKEVFKQLPNVIHKDIFVSLSDEQAGHHVSFAKGIRMILSKKFKTSHDWTRLMLLMNCMRMVCDSTFLIDKETNVSPKLEELIDIIIDKLNIKNNSRKIIIFSEWTTMLDLIGERLKQEGLSFALFTGKTAIKKRGLIIKEFEENPECNILLASEAGGAGLNLQMADTVINFELPWNPAKKNQRIGRINRIGQKKNTLNVYNLITQDSIEMSIMAGLFLKQNLFDGVLSSENKVDTVDFGDKGKSQFIRQLEAIAENENFMSLETQTSDESKKSEQSQQHLQAVSELEDLIGKIIDNESTQEPEHIQIKQPELILSEKTSDKQTAQSEFNGKETDKDFQQIEQVMSKGMEFLTGMFKMSTGKELGTKGEPIVKVDKQSGEISITLKMK